MAYRTIILLFNYLGNIKLQRCLEIEKIKMFRRPLVMIFFTIRMWIGSDFNNGRFLCFVIHCSDFFTDNKYWLLSIIALKNNKIWGIFDVKECCWNMGLVMFTFFAVFRHPVRSSVLLLIPIKLFLVTEANRLSNVETVK